MEELAFNIFSIAYVCFVVWAVVGHPDRLNNPHKYDSQPLMVNPERILCASIRFRASDGTEYLINGYRHPNCIRLMAEFGIGERKDRNAGSQGFLTSSGRWVDREEGMQIAQEAGQVRRSGKTNLYSEDLY